MTDAPKTYQLTVVHGVRSNTVRCVYLNEFRIVGNKPYVSEHLPHSQFEFTLEDLQRAFQGELVLGSAVRDGDS